MVSLMEPWSLAEDNPLLVASYAGQNTNMGKYEETRDGRTIKVCYVPSSGENNAPFNPRL